MWLIQWAAENGLSWLVSDGTVLGFAAVHPAQFIVLALIFLAIGFMVGYLVRGKITSVEVAKINATADAEIRKQEAFERIEERKRQREAEEAEAKRMADEKEGEERSRRVVADAIRHADMDTKCALYIMSRDGHYDIDEPDEYWRFTDAGRANKALENMRSFYIADYETIPDGRRRWTLTERAAEVIGGDPSILAEAERYVDKLEEDKVS